MNAANVQSVLDAIRNPLKAKILSRFFKTGKDEYGEGDIFLGVVVPEQRKIAKCFGGLPFSEILKLLKNPIHECRLTALFILIHQYQKGSEEIKKKIFGTYLKNLRYVNNWDLVDISAPKIVGDFLLQRPAERKFLYKLAKSNALWGRRVAILSTLTFIRAKQFQDTLKIAKILLHDKHDLIHKAVGWMLREIGKIDQTAEENFLRGHYKQMPRIMLRYAIEKFSAEKKKCYNLTRD
ncbi:DNA alkylation repair protein [Candidatus Peregrinibacteria bacterium]|nr:DNA alkylation repair protein [Candidatus Peregrinibacteria bacterium]